MAGLTFDEYQEGARLTMPKWEGDPPEKLFFIASLGLNGEAGEVAEIYKKQLGHGHTFSREEKVKECGDVLWYLAYLCELEGITLDEVARTNRDKLAKRYANGFSHEDSQKRVDVKPPPVRISDPPKLTPTIAKSPTTFDIFSWGFGIVAGAFLLAIFVVLMGGG